MNTTFDYQRIKIKEGIDLHLLRTSKFKTTLIKVFVQERLQKETAPMIALISYLLFRGTNTRPTTLEMMQYLEGLYGADLATDVDKRGETQYLSITTEVINQHYLPGGGDLLEEALALTMDVLTNPYTVDGKFSDEYFEQEKIVLKNDILSLINDKARYANERCTQLMCENEPYGIYKYGTIEDLETVDNATLYQYYRKLLANNPIHIFVIGDLDRAEVQGKVEAAVAQLPPRSTVFDPVIGDKEIHTPQTVIEEESIRQGKLAIGYRTRVTRRSPDYAAAQIFNGLFGSLPHSKLFQTVREKQSLAYYVYSRMDSTKGMMQVACGIESSDLEKVLTIIHEQLQAIIQGQITEQEMDFTKKAYRRYFRYLSDDNESLIDSCMVEVSNQLEPVLDELIEDLEKVTIEDVQAVARKLELDTIYFLKGKEGAQDEGDDVEADDEHNV